MTVPSLGRRDLLWATGVALLRAVTSQAASRQERPSGGLVWAFTHPAGQVESAPTVAGGTVCVGSDDETLYAVDTDSGTAEWTFTQPSGDLYSLPTVADGTLTCSMGGLGVTDDELKSYFRTAIHLPKTLVPYTPYYYSTSQEFLNTDDLTELNDDDIFILSDGADPDPHPSGAP